MNWVLRIAQLWDLAVKRLQAIPLLLVAGGVLGSRVWLWIDGRIPGEDLPAVLRTSTDSARTVLSAIAGGLISATALLLTLLLVAVQLASSQFSPRTLRAWTSNKVVQSSIGLVLGTAVFCLLVLRETSEPGAAFGVAPNLSVVFAVVGGVVSLVSVLVAVDHLADNLRIGSLAARIADETVELIQTTSASRRGDPARAPVSGPRRSASVTPPDRAVAVESPRAGWIQQIDLDGVRTALEPGQRAYVPVSAGAYVADDIPLAWVWSVDDDEAATDEVRSCIAMAFAIGDTRTMQQDVGFGILQLVDIAVRALSPGINDPNTANDVLAHLGRILLAVWADDGGEQEQTDREGRCVYRECPDHEEHLRAAIDPIRRYGAHDPRVIATAIRVVDQVRSETQRRGLHGPIEPLEQVIAELVEAVEGSDLSEQDLRPVRALADRVGG